MSQVFVLQQVHKLCVTFFWVSTVSRRVLALPGRRKGRGWVGKISIASKNLYQTSLGNFASATGEIL